MPKKDLDLRIKSKLNFEEDLLYTSASLTHKGTFVWVVLTPSDPSVKTAAVLFENEGGLLAEIARVPLDSNFIFPTGGLITPNGKRAYIAEENGDGQARVRIFQLDEITNPVLIDLPNIYGPAFSLITGTKVFKNRYITVAYQLADSQGEPLNKSRVVIIDLRKAKIISKIDLEGRIPFDAGRIFALDCELYISISTVGSYVDDVPAAPYFLQIYRLGSNENSLVNRVKLSSALNSQDIFTEKERVLIATGLSRTKSTLFGTPPNENLDLAGVQLYTFNGKKLNLVGFEDIAQNATNVYAVAFDPTGQFLAVDFATSEETAALDSLVVYKIECDRKIRLQPVEATLSVPNTFLLDFSEDCHWLISTGGPFGLQGGENLPEIILYQVLIKE